jgi:asparagine synthase (glutamine-hydrolysing)
MCGICGVWYFDQSRVVDPALLERMTQQVVHRGPDEDGFRVDGPLGLGFRRLSIIDVGGSHQPMPNEDQAVWIVFNGEIYNYQSLRERLQDQHQFDTQGDTETIVHAYEEYGARCVDYLRGMFAFAIWDDRAQKLTFAVDRFGKKPLYYLIDDEKCVFGSELKCILQHPEVGRDLDFEALDQYLTYGYIPAPYTIFADIRKLPPGHTLQVSADGRAVLDEYWHPHLLPPEEWDERPVDDLAAELRHLLTESVRLRMISDVPLGAFLSGGIDSSVVVSLMSAISTLPVKTFSIGFDIAAYDETSYAQIIADHCQTDHTREVVKVDVVNILPRLIRQYDEPFADSSMIPTYYVSEVAHRQVTVALSGDGGDEIFGGYLQHIYAARHKLLQSIIPVALRPAAAGVGRMLPGFAKVGPYLSVVDEDAHHWGLRNGFFTASQRRHLYSEQAVQHLGILDAERLKQDIYRRAARWDEVGQVQYDDMRMYLPADILVKVDRASMLASLEVRAPLLDHVVCEFMARVPTRYKTNGFDTKILLKKAMGADLPAEIQRRGKAGFSIPLREWLAGPLQPLVQDTLLDDRTRQRGLFNQDTIRQLNDEHVTGQQEHSERLWGLLCFELWARIYLDG